MQRTVDAGRSSRPALSATALWPLDTDACLTLVRHSADATEGRALSPTFSPLNSYGVLFAGVVVAVLSLLSLLRRPGVRSRTAAWLVGLCLGGAGVVALFASPGPLATALAALGGVLA